MTQYEEFQEKRKTLVALMHELREILSALDMPEKNVLKELETVIQSETFKVLVLGEFKRGKSTFINAMLRDEILPAYAKPCTAIINEVKWGETRRALLHFSPSEDAPLPLPQEVPIDQIPEYVVIKEDVSEIHGNTYDKVELFWPLPLCEHGVEIIDSPGLNEHDIRQKVTIDYLSKVDAILFVLSCEALAAKSEIDVIDNTLRPTGHEDIFFICNRFNMIRAKEKEDIRQYGLSRLAPRTKRGAERVFFISALDALEGHLEKDIDRVAKSGMLQVEQELEKFLANERGRIKILRPSREVQKIIYAARRILPERASMLKMDVRTLEARYEAAKEPLRRLEIERNQIVKRISNFQQDVKQTISAEACSFYQTLPPKISDWGKELKTQNQVSFLSAKGTATQVENLVQEVTAQFSKSVEAEITAWRRETLEPLISERLEALIQELDDRAKGFTDKVDDIRFQVTGGTVQVSDLGPRKVGALERILSAAGGLVLGGGMGFGMAAIGATFGYQEMLKSIIPQLALSIVTLVVVGFNPLVLIPLMAAGGLVQGLLTSKATTDRVKEEVAKRYAASLRDSARQWGNDVADAVGKKLSEIQNAIDQGLTREIQNVSDQVNSIVHEKQKGQLNVDQKLNELESLRKQIDIIDSELDNLIAEVALPIN